MNNENVKFLLNWNHFGEHLSSCMTKLMTDSSYSDIIIATGDKHMIYSHRFVLAYSSKYFQRLLRHATRYRGIQLVVALPEVTYEIFKILMNYMYKGETQVPHELLPSVIKAGQLLEINGLVNLSENDDNVEEEISLNSKNCSQSFPNEDKQLKRPSSTRESVHSREAPHPPAKRILQVEKAKRQPEDLPSESLTEEENGKENRSKTKSLAHKSLSSESESVIQLPLKRKTSSRLIKKASSNPSSSSSSFSNVSPPPKKMHKRHAVNQEAIHVKEKEDKQHTKHSLSRKEIQEAEDAAESITIKMEMPDDFEDVYNELQCEYCAEVYSNPCDWVRHMSNQHGDRGFKTYKGTDKDGEGNTVITCVICSSVCFSASDWARHLKTWHNERDFTLANMRDSRKTPHKVKRKSGLFRKEGVDSRADL